MVGVAAGMSKVGLNPVIHTIAPFLIERAYEQIKLDFGYQRISVLASTEIDFITDKLAV
jgi:transketolase